MNSELFCGIDPSFSGTGLVIINKNFEIVTQILISTKKKDDPYDIEKRMISIIDHISILNGYKNELKLISIEGISFGSQGEGADQLASLNYYIRIFLLQNNFMYESIPPSKLKKFITGKGQCKKNLMLKEIYKKWNIDFDDDNLADAYSLARMAHNNYYSKGKIYND